MDDCLFCKIVAGDVKADEVARNSHVVAFRDIDPKAPTHVLVIPTQHVTNASELEGEHGPMLANLFETANAVARSEGLSGGYRLVMNVGNDAGNSVPHLHLHVLGGRQMSWPPG
jgi:histidine triad (HIT) family protein